MKLKISDPIWEKYPDLRMGVVIAHGITNSESDSSLDQLKTVAEEKLMNSGWVSSKLLEHPFIAAWRDTYRSFGAKPKKYTPTAESLIKRVLKGSSLPKISVVVDAYLVVELEHFLPIGGYDLDTVAGDVVLRFSPGGEPFTALGGEKKETKPGEVVYSDEQRVLTVRWNYLDCDETKITLDTRNFVLCIEAADPRISVEALEKATGRLQEVLETYCPGSYKSFVADPSTNPGLGWEIW